VREKSEWLERSHPDALHIPLSELKAGTRLPPRTDQTLLLFCRTGARARVAKTILNSKGWKNIEVLTDFF
jgi:rhodanese-related sulfurtransferase